jgi:hypothetical protein
VLPRNFIGRLFNIVNEKYLEIFAETPVVVLPVGGLRFLIPMTALNSTIDDHYGCTKTYAIFLKIFRQKIIAFSNGVALP